MIWAAPVQQLEGSSWGLQNRSFLRKEVAGGARGGQGTIGQRKERILFVVARTPLGAGVGSKGSVTQVPPPLGTEMAHMAGCLLDGDSSRLVGQGSISGEGRTAVRSGVMGVGTGGSFGACGFSREH